MIKKKASEYTADELETLDVSMEEQEVVLQKSRDTDKWSLWVTDNLWVTKMKGLMKAAPEIYKLAEVSWSKDGKPTGYGWEFPKKMMTLRSKETSRVMTEEQREAAAKRLAEARAKRNKE